MIKISLKAVQYATRHGLEERLLKLANASSPVPQGDAGGFRRVDDGDDVWVMMHDETVEELTA